MQRMAAICHCCMGSSRVQLDVTASQRDVPACCAMILRFAIESMMRRQRRIDACAFDSRPWFARITLDRRWNVRIEFIGIHHASRRHESSGQPLESESSGWRAQIDHRLTLGARGGEWVKPKEGVPAACHG